MKRIKTIKRVILAPFTLANRLVRGVLLVILAPVIRARVRVLPQNHEPMPVYKDPEWCKRLPGETPEEYEARVPLAFRPVNPPAKLSYRGKPLP